MISLLLVDDHPVIRAGLRAMLAAYPDLTVTSEATTGETALDTLTYTHVDVILMDLNLGTGISGTTTIQHIQARPHQPAPHILVLTNTETESGILNAIEAGAIGYLLKDSDPDTLANAIRLAAQGRPYLDPAVTQTLLTHTKRPSHQSLTPREREILTLLDKGHSNRQIAAIAHIEEATVKAHLTRIFTKLGATSRTSALAAARQLGII